MRKLAEIERARIWEEYQSIIKSINLNQINAIDILI